MRLVILEVARAGRGDATDIPKPKMFCSVRGSGEVVGVCREVISLWGLVLEGVGD